MKKIITAPLPVKNGVSPNCFWLEEGKWLTMLDYFLEKFPHLTLESCIQRFSRQEVVTADGVVLEESSPYQSGQHIFFYREVENELQIPFEEEILYQDDNILVVDKPHFLPCAPSGPYLHETLVVRLRVKLSIDELEPCHRLDRETAGLVLFSKKRSVRKDYHALFSQREIIKTYHALAPTTDYSFPLKRRSRIEEGDPFYSMCETEGQINSETSIHLLEKRGENSLYELLPITGKKHQLRVHMNALKMPIINDPIYPKKRGKRADDFFEPLKLLAKSLRFVDPASGEELYFESSREL